MEKRLLFFAILLASITTASAQCPSVFYDGFESGTWTPTWTAVSAYTRVVDMVSPAQGSYSFHQTGTSGHSTGTSVQWPSATPPTIGWWAKTSSSTAASAYVVIGDANTSSNLGIVFSYFTAGNLRFYSGAFGDYNYPVTANTWYHCELRNINFTTKTYDIYIDNVLRAAGFGFRSQTTTSVDRIFLYNFSTATASYDDINIGGISLNIAGSSTDVLCNGDTTGTAMATASAGTTPYTYAWSNGATTQMTASLAAATYTVTVTDSVGCSGSTSVIINEPTVVSSTTSANDARCFGDSTGTASAFGAGGVPGYTYLWSNGGTGSTVANLPAGTYSVVVTDSNGCTHTDSATVAEPQPLVLSSVIVSPSCNGNSDGSITMVPTGGTPGYSYLWNTGATSQGLSNLPAGSYTCFVNDSLGCSDGSIFNLTQATGVTTNAVITNLNCNGNNSGAIDLSVSGSGAGITYLWSNGATTQDLTGVAAGTYTVEVTDSSGCMTYDTLVVTEPAALNPSAVIFNDQGTGNGSIDITVNGGSAPFSFAWSTGATTEDISNLSAGNYSVTITDNNGCVSTTTFTVSLIIGIQNGMQGPQVQVIPNPTNGLVQVKITLAAEGELHIRLTDLSGRVIAALDEENAPLQLAKTLDLTDLSSGVYLLQVSSATQQSWTRVMRQ